MARHEILRTRIEPVPQTDQALQVIDEPGEVPLEAEDWSSRTPAERTAALDRLLEDGMEPPAGLRGRLLVLSPSEHRLVVDLPPGSMDPVGFERLVAELAAAYSGPVPAETGAEDEDEPLQYADLAEWHNELQEAEETAEGRELWRADLAGRSLAAELSVARPAPREAFRPARLARRLDPSLAGELERLAEDETGVEALLFAAWQALLARLADGTSLTVGLAHSGRGYEELAGALGLFATHLPVAVDPAPEEPWLTFARRLARHTGELAERAEHWSWSLARPADGEAGEPFAALCFAVTEAPVAHRAGEASFLLETVRAPFDRCHLGLTVHRSRSAEAGGLVAEVTHDLARYPAAVAAHLLERYERLLKAALAAPETPVGELALLGEAERRALLGELAREGTPTGQPLPLDRLVARQATATPDAVALVWGERELTYRDLARASAAVAERLRSLDVEPGERVALMAARSPELVAGLLGILETGAAYVPLDPGAPVARLRELLEDSEAVALVAPPATEGLVEALGGGRSPGLVLRLEDLVANVADAAGERSPGSRSTLEGTAYLIYTSGSTGRPKGVMVSHRAIARRLLWMRERFPWSAEDRVLQKTSPVFDASIWELFLPLLTGGAVVLAPVGAEGDPALLVEALDRHRVTVLQLVPSMLGPFLGAADRETCPALTRLFAGGEALPGSLARQVVERLPWVELVNLYGPTETAIDATFQPVSGDGADEPRLDLATEPVVPIGRPLPHARVVVVDAGLAPVPVGVAGELTVAGEGLAQGYAGRPGATAAVFVPDPFGDEPGARLYRTGDLARMDGAGVLRFLGRRDRQVKLRGYRIEPGEIEAELAAHPRVASAAVAVRGEAGADQRLVAYLTSAGAEHLEPESVRSWLEARMPIYMVPSAWMVLEELPRLPSGKLDRRGLPEPPPSAVAVELGGPPRSQTERLLAILWSEVLELEPIGREDDFFALGGHSILATQLVARIREAFEVELPLRRLFELPRLAGQAAEIDRLARAEAGDGAVAAPPLEPVPRDDPPPLSFGQERLWFLERLTPGTTAYNLPAAVRIQGGLDVPILSRALRRVVERHEVLRTTFVERAGEPVQIIARPGPVPLPVVDLAVLGAGRRETETKRLLSEEAARPFDLARGPLIRARLVRLAREEHVALLDLHHAVSDGWSSGVLIREIATLYRAARAGEPSPLPPLSIQYADYAAWQRRYLDGERLAGQLAYWRECLAGAPQALELPTDRPRPAVQSGRGARWPVTLPPASVEGLRAFCRREGATLFMAVLALYDALLARLSGQSDLLVGTPVAHRDRIELEAMIGLFANTVVLRTEVGREATFAELVRAVRSSALEASAHQDLPFERLVEELRPARDLSRSPLFQVMLVLENRPVRPIELQDLTFEPLVHAGGTAKFDLELLLWEADDGSLSGFFEYSTDLFDRTTVARTAAQLARLAAAAAAAPDRRLRDLPLLGVGARHQILHEWNDSGLRAPVERSIGSWLVEHAASRGFEVAVGWGVGSLTYAELEALSGRVAAALVAAGVGPGTVVALLAQRGPELVALVLGVLRAGGAYLPLDPAHPAARMAQVLGASGAPLAVATGELTDTLEAALGELPSGAVRPSVLTYDRLAAVESALPGPEREASDDPAYVIFTSGSTGLPKGAVVTRRGMANHLFAKITDLGLGPEDVVAQTASQCFDISVWQMLAPLVVGARMEIFGDAVAHVPERLAAGLAARGVTVVETVPSLLGPLLEGMAPGIAGADGAESGPGTLRWMIPTGEALPAELARRCFERFPRVSLVNAYGPTECSDDVTHQIFQHPPTGDEVPIGRPVANLRVSVVDRELAPIPIGVAGEIIVGGVGVGGGYLGEPRRTATVFVPDPFSPTGGARLYRTGDLGRLRRDGALLFLGRLDHQVKVRGFRIELGEIEAALACEPEVERAVVVAREDRRGDRRLVAYLVGGEAVGVAGLRERLGRRLPEAMVPAAFAFLDELPLTANGKVDRKALPEPELPVTADGLEPPRTPTEELVAGIWSELLGVEEVGRGSDFFLLGGHSLLATRMISRLREALGVEVELREVFESPTLEALAGSLERLLRRDDGKSVLAPLEPRPPGARLELSHAQQRLWFLDQLDPGNPAYNIFFALRLRGSLDRRALAGALGDLVDRHRVLVTSFASRGGHPELRLVGETRPPLPLVDLTVVPERRREPEIARVAGAESERPFDLAQPPLLRVTVVKLGPDHRVLLVTLHHIAGDGWSIDVLVRELVALYRARVEELPAELAPLAVQYSDYASWQRRWLADGGRERLARYWRRHLGGLVPLELPTDQPRPQRPSLRGSAHGNVLSETLSRGVRTLARKTATTPFMVILAALDVLLARLTGRDDVVVGTDVANRSHVATERLIGLFVNHLVLRVDLAGDPTFEELLGRVRGVTLEAYAHQEMPFDQLVSELAPERELGHTPLFQVLLVYQNLTLARPECPGLEIEPIRLDSRWSKYDLSLFVDEQGEQLANTWRYRSALFERSTVERFAAQLERLLAQVVETPGIRLSRLDLLDVADKRRETMERQILKTSSLSKLKRLKPKAVSLEQRELVRYEPVATEGSTRPLLVHSVGSEVDLVEWAAAHRNEIEERLLEHGALVFRGFEGSSVETFERFAGSLCPDLYGEYGDLPREEDTEKVYHSTPFPPDKTILFHNESAHMHQWPRKQFFHCVIPAAEGGETPLVDCRRLYERLDPAITSDFRNKKLLYVRNFIPGVDVSWQDFFRTDDRTRVESYCADAGIEIDWKGDDLLTRRICPGVIRHPVTGEESFFNQVQLHHVSCLDPEVRRSMRKLFAEEDLPRNVTFGDGTPIPDETMAEIDRALWDCSVAFPWQAGDVIMLDNMLVAHARNPYRGPRKIVVAMGEITRAEQVDW